MRGRILLAALLAGGLFAALPPSTHPARADEPEEPSVLPDGEGRDETFYLCTACHSTAIIRRSGFTRQQWDDLMDWMVERQNMNPLTAEERVLIVDYLAKAFPPRRTRPPGFTNPFATN
jgi:hypothetical protein